MCKGADQSILSRLSHKVYTEEQDENLIYMKERILRRMKRYTLKGYRGLLMAFRFLSEKEMKYFKKKYYKICEMNIKEKKVEYQRFLEELESELILIGGSAVEDKLQDGLKDTIRSLRNAQMKIWVLTGDKMETAENIAISSGLFKKVTSVTQEQRTQNKANHKNRRHPFGLQQFAVRKPDGKGERAYHPFRRPDFHSTRTDAEPRRDFQAICDEVQMRSFLPNDAESKGGNGEDGAGGRLHYFGDWRRGQ